MKNNAETKMAAQGGDQTNEKKDSSIIRMVPINHNPFVKIDDALVWDLSLSLNAVGLWARLLSNPDPAEMSIEKLAKLNRCSIKKIYHLINELITNGYAYRYQEKTKGRFGPVIYLIFSMRINDKELQEILQFLKPSKNKKKGGLND